MSETLSTTPSFRELTNAGQLKVTAGHLKRDAFLYIRQSTLHQVMQNTESTQRQYALQQRAMALGWPMERIHVIDCDLGQSGASAVDREGFQELVAEVSLGHAGFVLGLEVSRLARNSADWQRLLELCGITDALILDEDGLYDCNDFNDRLLLGLKGTLSEAELHFLRARLRGGILNKARRGELASPLPVGLVYDEQKHIRLDPDQQVQQAIRLVFETFRRNGSAFSVLTHFKRAGLHFPSCEHTGVRKGELSWGTLSSSRVLQILHNPRYAGAFFFGRTRTRTWPDGSQHSQLLPSEEWLVLIPNLHVGYISWEEFQANQARLRSNSQAHGADRRKSPPREGPALLQGLMICGICGRRMTVRYHTRQQKLYPDYICQREKIHHAAQSVDAQTSVIALAISSDGTLLASGAQDGGLALWNFRKKPEILWWNFAHEATVAGIAISQDNKRVVSGAWDGSISVWEVNSGKEHIGLPGIDGDQVVKTMLITSDGKWLLSGTSSGVVKLWDMKSKAENMAWVKRGSWVHAIAGPETERLVFLSDESNTTLHVINLENDSEYFELKGHRQNICGVVTTDDLKRAISVSQDRSVKVWNLETGSEHATVMVERGVNCVAIGKDGETLLVGDIGGIVYCLRYIAPGTSQ